MDYSEEITLPTSESHLGLRFVKQSPQLYQLYLMHALLCDIENSLQWALRLPRRVPLGTVMRAMQYLCRTQGKLLLQESSAIMKITDGSA